jgi:hypothetical protein
MRTYIMICIVALVFFCVDTQKACASVAVDYTAATVVTWVCCVRQDIDRARMFYRALEGIIPTRKISPNISLSSLYVENMDVEKIKEILPQFFTEEAFAIFMPDWPRLAPIGWTWVVPSSYGIMTVPAGQVPYEVRKKSDAVPAWIVTVALDGPVSPFKNASPLTDTYFFKKALLSLQDEFHGITWEAGRLYVSLYPSGARIGDIVKKTYELRHNVLP